MPTSSTNYTSTVTVNAYGQTGASGAYLTGSGYTTIASWANPNTSFTSSNHKSIMTIPHGEEKVVLEKHATLEVNGNVKINGLDLEERLNTIEKLLHIPQRDVTMETKYPRLKELYDEYMHELAKYTTWDKLK